MNTFIPDLVAPDELPTQTALEDKFGGLPWGLPPQLWPVCADCGLPQTFLSQFVHHPQRLNLGRPGRMLFAFQCMHDPGVCETWDGTSGANACLVLEPEQLQDSPTAVPEDGVPLELELRVVDWIAQDDGITPEQAQSFLARDFDTYLALPDAVRDLPTGVTRLGSVPLWVQSPEEAPDGNGWRFVGQLEGAHRLQRPPRTRLNPNDEDGTSLWCDGPNFGGGLAYLFVDTEASPPQGHLFWQC
ncbi:hypothetical protein ACG04R_03000 [Roseateles sp. BYS78W]|uniref:DUF1963 domain-containing protein n=1 Tax=Pelomonas candidula TaxID=3299025 RepID=A0ABW7H6Z4_9BURK